MKSDFAHVLSALRHENSLSQKKAADDLGISQALLSHYENGVREPKLEFIIKACEYYGVTTDYILGRTAEKSFDGIALRCRSDGERRNADAASLIISLLGELGDDTLSDTAADYVNFSIYAVLKALRSPAALYDPLYDAALKQAESHFIQCVRRLNKKQELTHRFSDETLREKYPEQFEAMLELEEIINKAVSGLEPRTGE
jgi:transcriptional regulator with XRE-family HTH domain